MLQALLKTTVCKKSLQDGLNGVTAAQQADDWTPGPEGSPADLEVGQVVQLSDAVPGQV